MPNDISALLLLVLSSAVTFTLARYLSRDWRAKRRQRQQEEAEMKRRAGESRQVRRARERRNR